MIWAPACKICKHLFNSHRLEIRLTSVEITLGKFTAPIARPLFFALLKPIGVSRHYTLLGNRRYLLEAAVNMTIRDPVDVSVSCPGRSWKSYILPPTHAPYAVDEVAEDKPSKLRGSSLYYCANCGDDDRSGEEAERTRAMYNGQETVH